MRNRHPDQKSNRTRDIGSQTENRTFISRCFRCLRSLRPEGKETVHLTVAALAVIATMLLLWPGFQGNQATREASRVQAHHQMVQNRIGDENNALTKAEMVHNNILTPDAKVVRGADGRPLFPLQDLMTFSPTRDVIEGKTVVLTAQGDLKEAKKKVMKRGRSKEPPLETRRISLKEAQAVAEQLRLRTGQDCVTTGRLAGKNRTSHCLCLTYLRAVVTEYVRLMQR